MLAAEFESIAPGHQRHPARDRAIELAAIGQVASSDCIRVLATDLNGLSARVGKGMRVDVYLKWSLVH